MRRKSSIVRSRNYKLTEFANYAQRNPLLSADLPRSGSVNVQFPRSMSQGRAGSPTAPWRGAGAWHLGLCPQTTARFAVALKILLPGSRLCDMKICVSDPKIFGVRYRKSLGVHGTPVFRAKIVEAAGVNFLSLSSERLRPPPGRHCRLLDSARTFQRCRTISQTLESLLRACENLSADHRASDPIGTATVSSPPPEWKESVAAAQPALPAAWRACFFARRGPFISAQGTHPASGRDGPLRLRALADGQPPFCIPFLNGQSALFFPTTKATERQQANTVCFGSSFPQQENVRSWAIRFQFVPLSNRTFRPSHTDAKGGPSRAHPFRRCKRRVYSRMGPRSSGIAGDYSHNTDAALVATERSSHPHQQWRDLLFN